MKGFFKKNKTKEFADDDSELLAFKKKTLPPNFAERVLNLELDMEQSSVDIEKVNGLIELYASAIEYYESIHSDRFLVFQKKIKNLLIKPNVVQTMEKPPPPSPPKNEEKQKKLENHEKVLRSATIQIQNTKAKNFLEEETKTMEKNNTLIKKEEAKQQNDILSRLEARKNNRKLKGCASTASLLENIAPIMNKKDTNFMPGRKKTLISVDTDVLDNIIHEENEYKKEDKNEKRESSDSSHEFRKKSINMFRRASKDLGVAVEKRLSKFLNIVDIESAVRENRAISIKKHQIGEKEIVSEQNKKDETSSDNSSDSEPASDIPSQSLDQNKINLFEPEKSCDLNKVEEVATNEIPTKNEEQKETEQSENNELKEKEQSELVATMVPIIIEEEKKISEINQVTEEIQIEKQIEGEEIIKIEKEDPVQEKKLEDVNCEEKLESNENLESKENLEQVHPVENNQKIPPIEEKTEVLDSIPREELKSEATAKSEENFSKYEEGLALIEKKYSDKLNQFRNQLANSGGKSKLAQKMIEQCERDLENEKKQLKILYKLDELPTKIENKEEERKIEEKEKLEQLPEKIEDSAKKANEELKQQKIQAINCKYATQIQQFESQIKNGKGGVLITKLLEKLKNENAAQLEQIEREFS